MSSGDLIYLVRVLIFSVLFYVILYFGSAIRGGGAKPPVFYWIRGYRTDPGRGVLSKAGILLVNVLVIFVLVLVVNLLSDDPIGRAWETMFR